MGLQVEHPQRLQRQVQHLVVELFCKGRLPVQGVADPGCRGRELLEHLPLAGTVHPGSSSTSRGGSACPSTLPLWGRGGGPRRRPPVEGGGTPVAIAWVAGRPECSTCMPCRARSPPTPWSPCRRRGVAPRPAPGGNTGSGARPPPSTVSRPLPPAGSGAGPRRGVVAVGRPP